VKRRGITVIVTYVIVLALVIMAVGIAFLWGSQEIKKMEDQQQLQLSEGFMKNVDTSVSEIIKEGQYSARSLNVDLSGGQLYSKRITLRPSPVPPATGFISFPDASNPTGNPNFSTLAFRKTVLSDVVSSAGVPARSGNIVKRVTGTGDAYSYEIYEAYLNVTVENETVYNPTNGQNEIKIYVTAHFTTFNVEGQSKSNMKLRLQNSGYLIWETYDANFDYAISLIDTTGNEERYIIHLDGNDRIKIQYTPSYPAITAYDIRTVVLPLPYTSCTTSATNHCRFFRIMVTYVDSTMGVV
jgi:hypothetical protein